MHIKTNDTNNINHLGSVSDTLRRKARRKREEFINDHELVTSITQKMLACHTWWLMS
jgi:hypothetical protein